MVDHPRTRTVYLSDGLYEAFNAVDRYSLRKKLSFGRALEVCLRRGLRMTPPNFEKTDKRTRKKASNNIKAVRLAAMLTAKKAAAEGSNQ